MAGFRRFVSCLMIVLSPLSLLAADTGAAVVHSKGGVWVNGAEVLDSSPVFPGDVLQTKPGFVANLDIEGSSVLIQPESVVRFQGAFLMLEHGSISVGTSTFLSVHVNCIEVAPATSERTQYDLTDTIGKLEIAARKNEVTIKQNSILQKASKENASSQSVTLHEGEQTQRDESEICGPTPRPGAPGMAANAKWIGGAAGAGGLLLCLIFCRGSHASSVSPSQP